MGNCNCKSGTKGSNAICVECALPQMARNNYFTGKLLVERDFTDEQHYFMGKDRRHNQRLHGWGAVCGLKVSPNKACPDQYVLIDPGTAIDCCGREILVRHQECFDLKSQFLANWEAQNGPGTTPPAKPTDIQICVSYKECSAEEVPSLFDDCGGESSRPNRILESYGFDVLWKSSNSAVAAGVELSYSDSLNFADAVRVLRHDDSKRIYVLTSNATTAVLYALDTANESILIPPTTFSASAGLDLAVSPTGDFVYVAIQPAGAATAPQIVVLNQADLSEAERVDVGSATDTTIRLAVVPAPDGRVISVGKTAGVLVWPTTIKSSSSTTATALAIANPIAISVSQNGQYAYVLGSGANNVSAIALTVPGLTVTSFAAGTASATALAVASTTAGDQLAVLDPSGTATLFFFGLPTGPTAPAALGSVQGFANPPVDVQMAPGGRWAFVLEQDATKKNFVQAVDEHAVELGSSNVLGVAVPVGAGDARQTLSSDGGVLYVAYGGTASLPGSVAILSVTQGDCPDLFKQAIEPCPECDDGNCIVLATISGYVFGSPITDAQIDNYSDRHILASTSLLTDVVRCLLDQGAGIGKTGAQGPPGLPGTNGANGTNGLAGGIGPAGPGIDLVTVKQVPCDQPATAVLTGASPSRTLELTLPGCCNNDLTGIADVSWDHNGNLVQLGNLLRPGLGVAFSGAVESADLLTGQSVALLVPVANVALIGWQEIRLDKGNVVPGNFATVGKTISPFTAAGGQVNGLQINVSEAALSQIKKLEAATIRVVIKGDFIQDVNGKAVDGDHLPPWLPKRPTGDGIEGGTFESWFTIKG